MLLNCAPARALQIGGSDVDVYFSDSVVDYDSALGAMDARVQMIIDGQAREALWFLEHPPLYTGGTSARDVDLLDAHLPVYHTGRGGQFTYHGPGQRVVYVMLDLRKRGRDVRAFVAALEAWVIHALSEFQISAYVVDGRVGVWVKRPDKAAPLGAPYAEDKIAAIGVRLRKWVSFHGLSFNVEPDLSHYAGIVPCGIRDQGVTSLADLGIMVSMDEVDRVLIEAFAATFSL